MGELTLLVAAGNEEHGGSVSCGCDNTSDCDSGGHSLDLRWLILAAVSAKDTAIAWAVLLCLALSTSDASSSSSAVLEGASNEKWNSRVDVGGNGVD